MRVLEINFRKPVFFEYNLKEYEKKFNIGSEEFYKKYQAGKMGDSLEVIDWAGKFELLLDIKDEYQTLKEIEICT